MAYCTEEDVDKIIEGVENLKRGQEYDLDEHIEKAQRRIDGYLEASGHNVPFGTAPEFVQDIAATYAAYYLVRRSNMAGSFNSIAGMLKDDADKMLRDFASGQADTPGEAHPREEASIPSVVTWRD